MVPLKNTSSLHFANSLIVCRFSASLPKRRNATVSKVHTLFNCCILMKVYFKRYKWYRLKTRRVCFAQTSLIICALFAHELNNFQSSHFVQLFNFMEGITVRKSKRSKTLLKMLYKLFMYRSCLLMHLPYI